VQQLVSSDTPLLAAVIRKPPTAIGRSVRTIDAPRRTVLFRSGDPPSGIYIVLSGVVKLSLPSAARDEKVIALLGPGDSFGLSATLADKPHVVTAVVASDCRLAHLPRGSARQMMRRDPKFAHQIALELNRRFRDFLVDIQLTTRQSAIQRTAIFLLRHMPQTKRKQAITFRLPAKKADIASKLDLTGAHFSRTLHELHTAGLIRLQGSTLTVGNVARLRSVTRRTR